MAVFQIPMDDEGFQTISIPYAELYTALQTGVADGWSGGPAMVNYIEFRDVIKYFIASNNYFENTSYVMSMKSWEKLTPEQQKIVTEESAAAAKQARKLLRDNEAVQLKDLETTKGIVIARPDLGPWKAAMGPAWDKVKARVGADNFKRFMDMVEKNSK